MNALVQSTSYKTLENEFKSAKTNIRSFVVDEEGNKVEVAGAVCSARNSVFGFRNLETPVPVEIPAFLQAERYQNRGQPPVLKGSCTYKGKTVPFSLQPVSGVSNQVSSSGPQYDPNTGVYANPTTTRLTSRLGSTLPWRYPSVEILF